jgi:ribosomal protein S18 acetylase RimI-like enzyme
VRRFYRPNPAAHANLSAIAPALERLVTEDAGQIVGTVRFGIFDGCLRIIGLAVLPRFQCRGVARALIEELARLAGDKWLPRSGTVHRDEDRERGNLQSARISGHLGAAG